MTQLKMKQIDHSLEEMILTGMIVDTDFFNRLQKAGQPQYFESDVISILVEWVQEYGKENNWIAPREQIKTIFKVKQNEFTKDEAITVRIMLNKILKDYATRPFNSNYVRKRAVPYLKKKAFKFFIHEAEKLLSRDRVDEAEILLDGINKKIAENIVNWSHIYDPNLVNVWWDISRNSVIKFPRALGEYLPTIRQGKLYTLLAPPKRGKSFWLLYWALIAIIDGLNVTFFSLEMEEEEVHERISKMISGMTNHRVEEMDYLFPVLDCENNQTGECERAECTSPNSVVSTKVDDLIEVEDYEDHPEHRACTACRGTERYTPTTWMETITQSTMTKGGIKRKLKKFTQHVGDRLRIISHPIGTAAAQDMERDLDNLERTGFYTDFAIVDYAQIMKLDKRISDKRNQISDVYSELSRVAKTRNIGLATGAQGNRASASKNRLTVEDIAEDWGIIMIIDGIIAINEENFGKAEIYQTDRYWKRQRIETLALRYGEFLPGRQCLVLVDWVRAQVNIDSVII